MNYEQAIFQLTQAIRSDRKAILDRTMTLVMESLSDFSRSDLIDELAGIYISGFTGWEGLNDDDLAKEILDYFGIANDTPDDDIEEFVEALLSPDESESQNDN